MNEFLEQFLVEGRELVEQATSDLLMLERMPLDRESLDGVFRAFHTLKGAAGIVDFAAMSRTMHAAEDVLSAVRSGDRPVTSALISDCLVCLDQVVQWLDKIQDSGNLPGDDAEADANRVTGRFLILRSTDATKLKALPANGTSEITSASPVALLKEQLLLLSDGDGAEGRRASAGRLAANVLRHIAQNDEAEKVERALLQSRINGDFSLLTAAIESVVEHFTQPIPAEGSLEAAPRAVSFSPTLRVDIERVNNLVNITSELTAVKNAFGHIAKLALETNNAMAAPIKEEHVRLDHLVEMLQHAVRGLRILPLRVVFQRFSRVIREMSESNSKPVRLITEGDETEADKAIVELLFEPLLHVVRNAIDHGIEPAEQRAVAGKSRLATLSLRGRREGEHVVIEVEDDGGGIDVAKIREIVADRRILSVDVLSAMSDTDVIDLIFLPGFSTAREISGVSGRGVGMDAVRTAVERLRGRVFVETQPGKGCTVRFVLPFSIMMAPVVTVEAGGQIFGIPLDAVVETIRVPREQIHPVGEAHAFVLRNQTVPLIDMGRTLGRGGEYSSSEATVVVTLNGGQLAGLEVERLGETMLVMLKPPDGLLSGMPGIAGTAMLGDGSILLVLDLQEVMQ